MRSSIAFFVPAIETLRARVFLRRPGFQPGRDGLQSRPPFARAPFALLFILLFLSSFPFAWGRDLFLGPIPVQFVSAGEPITLDMRRFYEPEGDPKLQVENHSQVEATFDPRAMELRLKVATDARGLIDLPFKVEGGGQTRSSIITLAIRPKIAHEFTFRPATSAKRVVVAGSFNGWSKDANAMSQKEDGTWSTRVLLDPGTYSYKFVVDDQWQTDPKNPQTTSDGMGGTNSMLKLGAASAPAAEFGIFLANQRDGAVHIHAAGGSSIKAASVVADLPDGSTRALATELKSGAAVVETKGLPRGSWVRGIAATADDTISNTVRLPVTSGDEFYWGDAVIYYAFTDRFADGDKTNSKPVEHPELKWPANFHGGDWAGIEQKIKEGYFEALGINAIWLAPLNQNPQGAYKEFPAPHRWYTGYHGYWPVSATEVEPHFGDAATLKRLVKEAHSRGIKVIADLVLHHVHTEHPWWKEHRDWFGTLELPDGTKNLRKWDEHQFTTWFEPYLPTFNFDNAAAVAALIENSIWWANEFNLDGFRLDAVKHIPQDFWPKFRKALREHVKGRPLYLVGETFKDRAGIASFVGPNMLDGQFDFPLYDTIMDAFATEKAGLDLLELSLDASEATYGKQTLMSPLIGNHDKGRFMAFADGDLPAPGNMKEEEVGWTNPPKIDHELSFRKLALAQAFLMSIDGAPMIYYGDEFGMTGAGDPDNRRDMRFSDQLSEQEKRALEHFRLLSRIRREHPALRYGSRRSLVKEKEVLSFVRAQLDDRVLCVFNRGSKSFERTLDVAPELPDGQYVEAISGGTAEVKAGKLSVSVPPRSAAFFVPALPR